MSSRKNVLLPYKDPAITSHSMASSFNGTPVNIQYQDNIAVQLVWTGANPVGTINIQVSLDNIAPVTWTTITGTSVTPGGTPGNAFINLTQLAAPWIRIMYVTAGGSVGNLTATIGAKMI